MQELQEVQEASTLQSRTKVSALAALPACVGCEWMMSMSTAKTAEQSTRHLCTNCQTRPRLGTLSRCGDCVRASAEEDRQSRQAAETRVASKKSAREAEARVAAERRAALEKLGDAFIEFASSPEGAKFLESQQAALVAPRNDPEYVNGLIANDEMRQSVANEVTLVTHAVEWGRNRIGLTLRNDRDHATARVVAGKLQSLFESELVYVEDPHDQSKFADRSQKRPPKHEFGRTSRSKKR
jgi:hypothetical protein